MTRAGCGGPRSTMVTYNPPARHHQVAMTSDEPTDIPAGLLWLAKRAPSAPAILVPGRVPLSFGDLAQHIERTARQLAGWGIARGDVVVWANGERSETA